MIVVLLLLFCITACYGQAQSALTPYDPDSTRPTLVSNQLTEKIGNFSIELLYHTAAMIDPGGNMIISPVTVWTALAVIAEGSVGQTRTQIRQALRLDRNKTAARVNFAEISQWLDVIQLVKFNGIFVDKQALALTEFQNDAKTHYGTNVITLNLTNTKLAANLLNRVISNYTHGRIPSLIREKDFEHTDMDILISSAMYFKGKWKIPFNATSTRKQPFYDIDRNQIGEVNLMYNRGSYPVAEIKALQARVIELPIGKENRLSMVVMLPNYGVSLEGMVSNFQNLSLEAFFMEFKPLVDDFTRTEVEFHLPRFKIKSDLDLTEVLKQRIGIKDLFDKFKSKLPYMARTPLYASKLIHKAEIEVTEEGLSQEDTEDEFSNRIGVVWFEANRPFTYMIVEKITNTIILGGFYKKPSLY